MKLRYWALIVVWVLVVGLGSCYFSDEHQRFLAFDARRTQWHLDCDVYRNVTPTTANARKIEDCQERLDALSAYAKRNGWMQ